MDAGKFVSKWRQVELTERSAYVQHFLDLCHLVGHPEPAEVDPKGEFFTIERGVQKRKGGKGWADVWKKGFFAFEYKGKHKNLDDAYDQLLQYRGSLENPPLLSVCDMDRLIIHTNFTGAVEKFYEIPLEELPQPKNLDIIHRLFYEPDKLKPTLTREAVTVQVAKRLGDIAQQMRGRGLHPHGVARFLDRVVFCLFAEDVGLLPSDLFTRLIETAGNDPTQFFTFVGQLFKAMSKGGNFGLDAIKHFNGNLFDSTAVVQPTTNEILRIKEAAKLDWDQVDPSIFGTLFERGMDPGKRSQLGAHYTSREDIETVIDPVVMQPLRREWDTVRRGVEEGLASGPPKRKTKKPTPGGLISAFLNRLQSVTILDPACGSGNFLYVALQKLKDLEQEILVYAEDKGLGKYFPFVGPWQLHGIEKNQYAFELAQVSIWIGHIQWQRANGYRNFSEPILRKMTGFECKDAILDLSDPMNPKEPDWPEAEFIVGNPPFLGNKRMRVELGDEYCDSVRKLYHDRIPAMSDLCCYWFEKARAIVASGKCEGVGLLATTGIKQVGSRPVLERVQKTCRIAFAVSDRDWALDGASVRISIIGFFPSTDNRVAILDGQKVETIHADLTAGCDLSKKKRLPTNIGRCFMGTTKVGAFDIEEHLAIAFLKEPNPHQRPNSEVLRPFRNGSDLVRVCSNRWIIDFGVKRPEEDAAYFVAPFEHLVKSVKKERQGNNDRWRSNHWWMLGRTIPDFRRSVSPLRRYIGTPRVAKHRIFVWIDAVVLPDSKVIAITLQDDFSFGILQSHPHKVWTLANCGWHGAGNDVTYNPTTCFETFPFPNPSDAQRESVATAAKRLEEFRSNWLNPPEFVRTEMLEFPGSVDGPWAVYVQNADPVTGIGTVRYPRKLPRDSDTAKLLAKRTLTNLYNERPTWLDIAHRELDRAVFTAYGWDADMTDEAILEALLALNLARVPATTSAVVEEELEETTE